jgi:diguanylate cyclase (GGDEF)-like protein
VLRLYNCIVEQHDLILVGLAALVCATGAFVTFVLAGLARADGRGRRWLAAAGLVSGTSVWATHFVAMLAFEPGVPTGYDPALTLVSLALPVLVGWAAFHLAAGGPAWRAAAGGALLGAGIMAMHYIGMAAYQIAGGMVWDTRYVAVSVGSALAFPVVAFLARRALPGFPGQAVAALLLILGVVALHFVGMAAILVLPDPDATPAEGLVPPDVLAAAVGLGALLILCAGLAAAAQALRFRRREREEAERLRSLADATIEGLLVCDGPRIVASNRSIRDLLGRPEAWLAGRALSEVIPDLPGTPPPRAEVTLLPAEGEAIPAEIVARPIAWRGRPHRVLAVRDLRDRQEAEARIRFLAAHDPLTRLPNRAGFAEQFAQALAHRGGQPFAMVALDLDRFKMVNDTLGHAVGDALLVKAAARLRAAVRATDLVCRLGGDEFAVVQFAPGQPEAATALAQRLCELLSRPFLVNGQILNIGTSIGIALFPADGHDQATLTRNADLALYRAKSEGRGTYRFFETEMDSRMQRRRMMEVELRGALALRQFHLLYQPQLQIGTGTVTGFEALIRWSHPERGLVPPGDFIPLAEETGLIVPIGEWVLREACREAASWPVAATIAVNLSPVQFASPGLVETVRGACAAAGLDPRRLELEITESVLLAGSEATLATLRELKALGAQISMDDFGTGYSSLSYLRSFPFDKIKIDRSFITDVTHHGEAAAIVRAIVGLGRSLGMATTVEGVETEDQLAHLRAEGCDQAQGYLIGRPLPAQQAQAMLGAKLAA